MSFIVDDIIAEMEGLTFGDLSRRAAELFGNAPYLIDDRGQLSFAEVDAAAARCAAGLLAAGLGPGSKIAVWLPNGRNWVISFIAIAKIGALMIPINTRYKADEARYVLERSEAEALIMMRRNWDVDYIEILREVMPSFGKASPRTLPESELPALQSVALADDRREPGTLSFGDLLASAPAENLPSPRVSDRLLICFTSGSTGKPKGVMHSHAVIVQAVRVGLAMRMGPTTPILGHMPFYHSAGLFMALIPALALGSPLVLMEDWKPDGALDLIERHGISRIGGVPTHFYDLVEAQLARPRRLDTLEAAWIGGSAIMQSSFRRIMSVLGLSRMMSTYGMTENTISTTFNRWDDPVERCCSNSAPKLSDCEVMIVDPATFEQVPEGQEGELWCRGRTVMQGYYRDADATAAVITPEGWLRSGDLAVRDTEGYISITGRLKEILKVGGVNVSPIEVEQVLTSHPAVRAAAVVPLPHKRLTEVPLAFLELHEDAHADEAELVAYCRERMAGYKAPHKVIFVEALPRTETGKIKRADLARQVAAQAAATVK